MEFDDVQGGCSIGFLAHRSVSFLAHRPLAQHKFIGGKAIGRTSSVQRRLYLSSDFWKLTLAGERRAKGVVQRNCCATGWLGSVIY